jgi:outer membrane protein assembly factor BamA
MKKKIRFALVVVFLLMEIASAQLSVAQDSEKDSSRIQPIGLYPIPILFYTPETGIAGGAAALYLYRDPSSDSASRPTNFTGDIIYSEKEQIIVELNGDMYFGNGVYRLLTNTSYKKFPNKFFGIGNNNSSDAEESYTPRSFFIKAVFSKNIYSRISAGPILRFETTSIIATTPGGLLASGTIAGGRGGFVSGLGLAVNWDSRDNTFATYAGSFLQLTTLFYRRVLGSDFSYIDVQLDARNFVEVFPSQILAIQGAAEIIDGVAPFQNLARYGGASLLRGYFEGQYRDNTGVALQAEYRFPLWWRIGAVAFAGVGQVGDIVSRWNVGGFRFAGGAGVRILLNTEDRVALRVDLGFGDNSSGLYFTATEAF